MCVIRNLDSDLPTNRALFTLYNFELLLCFENHDIYIFNNHFPIFNYSYFSKKNIILHNSKTPVLILICP